MTFNRIKNKLDNMSEKQHDEAQTLLAKLYSNISKKDKKTAAAIEIASIALMLYTNGGKYE